MQTIALKSLVFLFCLVVCFIRERIIVPFPRHFVFLAVAANDETLHLTRGFLPCGSLPLCTPGEGCRSIRHEGIPFVDSGYRGRVPESKRVQQPEGAVGGTI